MTAFAGLRGTGDFATDERPKSFREMILWLDPNGQAPIFGLTSKMASEGVDDPEFAWWEEEQKVTRLKVSDGMGTATTATTLQASTVANVHGSGLSLVVGDLLMVEKTVVAGAHNNEIVRVTAVTDALTITIARAQAGTTAAAIPADAFLLKIGNVFSEGTTSPTVSLRNPVKKYNYTQIFKTAYEVTRTAKQTRYRTGDPLKNDKKRKMFDHAAAIEYALIFGQRFETTGANGKPLRYTGGFLDQTIGTQTTLFATAPTENALLDAFEPYFRGVYAGLTDQRFLFAGNGFINAVNKKIKDSGSTRIMFTGELKTYGMTLDRIKLPFGEVAMKSHPLLNNHPLYTNSALMIAPTSLKIRTVQDTIAQDNIQPNDQDGEKGQWLTELGLELHHALTVNRHFHMTNPAVA